MKKLLLILSHRDILFFTILLFLFHFTCLQKVRAQSSNLLSNEYTPITSSLFGNLSVTSTQSGIPSSDEFSPKGNVIDPDLDNTADWSGTAIVNVSAWIEVKDDNATGSNEYKAGSYAGFVVADNSLLSALGGFTITTFLGNTEQESQTSTNLVSIGLLNGQGRIGFLTTKNFDRIRLTYNGGILGLFPNVQVSYAVVGEFSSPGPELDCNTNTYPRLPDYPMVVEPVRTGFSGISIGTITNPERAVDNDTNNYASINFTVSLAATASFSIQDQVTTYPAGTFAGMDIDNPSLLGVGLLDRLTITTYLDGVQKDVFSGSNLVSVPSSLLSGTGRQIVGFVTTMDFDEVQITLDKLLNVSLGATRIYGMVLKKFCTRIDMNCNTMTPVTNPDFPVYVNGANTGVESGIGACVGCEINDSENVIDANTDNFATLVFAAGVNTGISFSVAHAIDTYEDTTFVGFEIGTTTLVAASLAGSATIKLYNNGTLVRTGTGNALLVGANTDLLTDGLNKQTIGILAYEDYDEVQITFSQLAGLNLGTINIYSAIFTTSCPPTILCDQSYYLTQTDFPAYINSERTGTAGVVGALGEIEDAWNVVSASNTDYATIRLDVGVAGSASISVMEALTTYPIGTIAGFTIETKNTILLDLDLFDAITISTYLDGVFQESKTGSNLINLGLLGLNIIGTGGSQYDVGFVTTLPFDEVQITLGAIVGVDVLNETNVYGAYFDTRYVTTGPYACYIGTFNPDFNSTYVNVTVNGDVSTNDQPDGAATYGTPQADAGNPAGGSLNMNNDGSYDFSSANPGVYNYAVPVCVNSICTSRTLQITVLDDGSITNPPVVNPDYGSGPVGAPIIINSVANDGPGNKDIDLDTTSVSIVTQPTNGSASVNGSTGVITYTPNPGFTGRDSLEYMICDKSSNCGTTYQYFNVIPDGLDNTTDATDDFVFSQNGEPASGNVSTNDIDPEGDAQSVTAQNTSIPGVGTLNLMSNGEYTFTAEAGFTGPYDFPYTTCDASNCATATLHVLVGSAVSKYNPDFNSTYINKTVNGDVSTNDQPVGVATYGTPQADAGNPAGGSLNMNNDGSYDFTASNPGIYNYDVPVCANSICTARTLQITVLDDGSITNPPVVNPDYGSGPVGDPIVINSVANDGPGNKDIDLDTTSVSIVTQPSNGNASVNGSTGEITYTPDPGFTGRDSLEYMICDKSSNCGTTFQYFTVLPNGLENTTDATDDFVFTPFGGSSSGNVSANDIDPEGDSQTVTAQNTSIPGVGTLNLSSNGDYTFTPEAGFTGSYDFAYTTCDGGSPQACAMATLHVLVGPMPSTSKMNPDFNSTYINVPVNGDVSTNDQPDGAATYGTPQADAGNPSGGTLNLNSDGSYDFTASNPGVYNYDVPVCVNSICTSRTLQITVLDDGITTNPPVVNPDYGSGPIGDPIVINSVANDGPGNEGIDLDTTSVSIVAQPPNGNASVNVSTGEITYTPDPGYTGRDSLEYMICDEDNNCGTTFQYFTVYPEGVDNTTDATDDFVFTPFGGSSTGNVSTNDIDPEGDAQTVQTQNTTVPGVGTLNLSSNGDYTFTPESGFTGPYDFTYTTCETANPSICASATLHVLVGLAVPDLTPGIQVNTATINEGGSVNITYNYTNLGPGNTDGSGIEFRIFKLSTFGTITLDPLPSGWSATDEGNYYSVKSTNIIQLGSANRVSISASFVHDGDDENAVIELITDIIANSGGEVNSGNNYDNQIIQIN